MAENDSADENKDHNKAEWAIADRDRGILTKHDRAYLLGEKKLDGQDERNARYRIRNRTQQAIVDAYLISHYLSSTDKSQLADALSDQKFRIENCAHGVVSLAYSILKSSDEVDNLTESFNRAVELGVSSVESPTEDDDGVYRVTASVSVDVNYERLAEPEDDKVEIQLSKLGEGVFLKLNGLSEDDITLIDDRDDGGS